MREDVGELTEIADGIAVADGVIPNKAGRGINQGVATAITAGPTRKAALHIVRDHGGGGPFMAVGAQNAAAIGIIQKDEIVHELMLVGSDALAELAQISVAVAFPDIAEDLVVGAVFLDDVNDVMDFVFAGSEGDAVGVALRGIRFGGEIGPSGEMVLE